MSASSPAGRPLLLAAVGLSASLGLVGGAAAAWGLYQRLGPAREVVAAAPPASGSSSAVATYGDLAARVAASVVKVVTQPLGPADLLAPPRGLAVGFVAGSNGLVVTSAHAVRGATQLRLVLADGRLVEATVAASDPAHGVVVLQASVVQGLTPLSFPDAAAAGPRAGDLAVAVGSPPLAAVSVTAGTIRATGLEVAVDGAPGGLVDDAIAVDATADPADDGAPLLDAAGEVIGVVVAAAATAPPGLVALSGRAAAALVDRAGRGAGSPAPGFGAEAVVLDPATAAAYGVPPGALVRSVVPGGPADAAGLRPGDVVTAVSGTTIDRAHPFDAAVLGLGPGAQVTLTVVRQGIQVTLTLTVG